MKLKKVYFYLICLLFFTVVGSSQVFAAEASWAVTGVLQNNSAKAYDGYTLFDFGAATYLIDMKGHLRMKWEWESGGTTELLENGHLLRHEAAEGGSVPNLRWGGESGQISEYDWYGNLIWRYVINEDNEISHHWISRTSKGTTLVMVWERISYDDAVDAGRDPSTLNNSDCRNSVNPGPGRYICDLWPDKIVELDSSNPADVKEIWTWRAWDHMVQDFDPEKDNYGNVADNPDKIDINFRFPIERNSHRASADFGHANKVTYYEEGGKGRVILNLRVFGEFFVIDYDSKKIIDRWGNPCSSKRGECPSYMNNGEQQLFGPHASNRVAEDSPGAGNMVIWDNGWMRPASISIPGGFAGIQSRALEVDLKREGREPFSTSPADIVWQYMGNSSMYSAFVGDARRLPNGNTLMSSSIEGHFLEVTPEGEIVWEYVVPLNGDSYLCVARDSDFVSNFTGVVRRYATDFSGFAGKHLWGHWEVGPLNENCWPSGKEILDHLTSLQP